MITKKVCGPRKRNGPSRMLLFIPSFSLLIDFAMKGDDH
jgi:hypothetical protein